jgi:quercetin dioxygenase-like cupin family protein
MERSTLSYSVVDVADLPTVWGTFKFVRHHLGARAFGLSQIDFPPGKVGSEHDERASRQEEVYLTLSGGGTLEVDGDTIEMKPGRYVLVPPESKRRPAAGPEGMSFLVIGGVPGDVYEPWTPPDE